MRRRGLIFSVGGWHWVRIEPVPRKKPQVPPLRSGRRLNSSKIRAGCLALGMSRFDESGKLQSLAIEGRGGATA
jgi:hypothetical protein